MLNTLRQQDIISANRLAGIKTTLVGAGAIGSFSAITLTKMGIMDLEVFDDDGITDHNLPNQFYRVQDISKYKVDSLYEIIGRFSDVNIIPNLKKYKGQQLGDLVVVTTDTMASRRLVWEQFLKQEWCKWYIEARMGAELGIVYSIRNKSEESKSFYEKSLYSDEKVIPLRCTQKAIIYNVLMIASLIGRSVKAIVGSELFPREVVFNMEHITKASFLIRE